MFVLANRNISWIPKRQALEATGPYSRRKVLQVYHKKAGYVSNDRF
jgi:hypothetical protein